MSTISKNQSVKLTQTQCAQAPIPDAGQLFLRDTELKGFALRILPSGTKTFILEKRIEGRVRRFTIGRYGELTVVQARKQAMAELGKIALGGDPIADRKRARMHAKPLKAVYQEYLASRRQLSVRTRGDYDRLMEDVFSGWQRLPLDKINKVMVSKRHKEIGERGEAYANNAFRLLRAIFNFAMNRYEDAEGIPIIKTNPVSVLTRQKEWYRVARRSTYIHPTQLKKWYRAVDALRGTSDTATTVADYLELLVFTGLRRTEAATLQWNDLDFQKKTLMIRDPKNHQPLVLPLSNHLVQLLKARTALARNEYVFHGLNGRGYLIEPKRQIQKVIAASGVSFILHDLRRTFITIAESMDLSPYVIKRLVNHKIHNDVTAGYIVTDLERMREPMNQISKFLLSACGVDTSEKVISLTSS